jgi:putative membrane protein
MASGVIPGFMVDGFWIALLGSFLISLVSFILNTFIGGHGTVVYVDRRTPEKHPWE